MGELSHYIGTLYYYYTYQSSDGSTAYASKTDYEAQTDGSWEGPQITRHRSLIQICIEPDRLDDLLSMTTINYILAGVHVSNDGFFVAFDNSEEHRVVYSPIAASIGKTAAEIGVSENAFLGNYNGFQTVNGVKYFQRFGLTGDYYVATAMPTDSLYTGRDAIAGYTTLVCGLFLIILTTFVTISSDAEDAMYRSAAEEYVKRRNEQEAITLTMPSGKEKKVKSAASRWDGEVIPWSNKTPEQKFTTLLKGYSYVLTAFVFVTIIGSKSIFSNSSIISYILSGEWDKSFNIFALTACGALLLTISVGTSVAKLAISTVTNNLGTRSETIGHLVESVIKYGGTLAGLFFSLYLLGLNAGSLLTSAGILSIVIGLGAQSLISDILAGIFIVFEGEFRVGDIVTVGDFRGSVLEIGLRTTKIEDPSKNIKIFNNSEISGVVNMTKETSYASCDVGIEYGESIERVEAILNKEFPNIKKRLPTIIDGPFYKGVIELGESSVNIRIIAQCAEQDRIQLGRDLNREIFMLFNKHQIGIPFPQVTLSYLSEETKEATPKQKREASEFVAEQKDATKFIEDEHED